MKFLGKIKIKCRSGNRKLSIDLHGPSPTDMSWPGLSSLYVALFVPLPIALPVRAEGKSVYLGLAQPWQKLRFGFGNEGLVQGQQVHIMIAWLARGGGG